jgi:CDP-glucose 4,6-dehydratase
MNKNDLNKYFKRKKIIVTGHTGFKGSWLTLSLKNLGANVLGISKNIPTKPSNYQASRINNDIQTKMIDIKNFQKLKKEIKNFEPDFIFHLAAQSLVGSSYQNPRDTWETNLIGTINILEILKDIKKNTVVVIITSDKAYKNIEKKAGYKETDILAGIDPYSASKSSAEIAIKSYFDCFLKNKENIKLGIARAGNVIGGGDWSKDRLIPDCVRSWSKNKSVTIRNPHSTRPWQHVLEAVWAYILFAYKLKTVTKLNGQAFNFGPNNTKNYSVIELLNSMRKDWKNVKYSIKKSKKFKESNLLKLNCNKAKKYLGWENILKFNENIKLTAEWYQFFYSKKNKIRELSLKQIESYKNKFIKNF